jgi:hypothetical protein
MGGYNALNILIGLGNKACTRNFGWELSWKMVIVKPYRWWVDGTGSGLCPVVALILASGSVV